MTLAYATEVATWRYPPPYDLNDMTGADPAFLASPESGFWALTGDGELIGFRSFGPDGRVPGYDYDESALDTGGGLRPDLTGRGLGAQAISAGLAFGQREFAPAAEGDSCHCYKRAGDRRCVQCDLTSVRHHGCQPSA